MSTLKIACWLAATVIPIATAHGAFILLDNFQEPLGTQTWLGEVVADPTNPSNSVSSGTFIGSTFLPSPIAQGSVGTIFFRAYWDYGAEPSPFGGSVNVGTSDLTPAQIGTNAFSTTMNTTGYFAPPLLGGSPLSNLSPDVWYNFWVVVNNSDSTASYYISTGDQQPTSPLAINDVTNFPFINPATGPIQSLAFSSHVLIDDIYEDPTTQNLSNPVPEPSSLAFALLATTLLLCQRPRQHQR